MDKLDQLFIRACKSKDPMTRLMSLRKRFYYVDSDNITHLIVKLADICDEYLSIKVIDVVEGINPRKGMFLLNDKPKDYNTRCLRFLVNKIRFSKTENFPGLTDPAMFRKAV